MEISSAFNCKEAEYYIVKGRVKKNVVFPLHAYQNGQNTYFHVVIR